MLTKDNTKQITEPTPAGASDFQTNTRAVSDMQAAGTSTKKLKTYPVIALVASDSGGPPTVREIKIQAYRKKDAEKYASWLLVFLDANWAQAITTEYSGLLIGSGLVLKAAPALRSKQPSGRAWTIDDIGELLSETSHSFRRFREKAQLHNEAEQDPA